MTTGPVTLGTAPTAEDILSLEVTAPRRFRSRIFKDNPLDFVFGGRPIAQALAAATRTAQGSAPRACSGFFLGRGRDDASIDYDVDILRDGRELAMRRVRASQDGRAIFEMLCTLSRASEPAPIVESRAAAAFPESTPSLGDFVRAQGDRFSDRARAVYLHPFPVELRLADPTRVLLESARDVRRDYWLRAPSAAAFDDPVAHRCLIGYLSDYWFASVVGAIGSATTDRIVLTTNHTLAFHADARADDWLLHRTEALQASAAGGFVRGTIHARDGRLVASTTQDVVIRKT